VVPVPVEEVDDLAAVAAAAVAVVVAIANML